MRYSLVIFDLDGTLLDTLDDIKNAVNYALRSQGMPVRTREQVRMAVGNGVEKLMARALPPDATGEAKAEAVRAFKAYYEAPPIVETRPYPGVMALLRKLNAAGIQIAINSNKYDGAVQTLCRAHFPGLYVRAMGESPQNPKKPSPAAVNRLIAELKIAPARALYVGDTAVDLETAKNAGIDAAWVSWGFRTREEMGDLGKAPAFGTAEDLLAHILR